MNSKMAMMNALKNPAVTEPGPDCNPSSVVLVALRSKKFPFIGESQGTCAIAGYLRYSFPDVQVKTFDLQLQTVRQIISYVLESCPALIGVSIKLQTFEQMLELHQAIRSKVPRRQQPVIVVGNAVASLNAATILEQWLPDVIIGIGEGELAMGDMVAYLRGMRELRMVRNVWYWDAGNMHQGRKTYLDGTDVAPSDRTMTLEYYCRGGEVYVEGSRGCAYGLCSICTCSDHLGSRNRRQKWRPRPIPAVVEELRQLRALGIDRVTFADEDFFGPSWNGTQRASQLAGAISESTVGIEFRVNAHVKSIFSSTDSPEAQEAKSILIEKLAQAGLVKIFLGLESGSKTQLRRFRKGFSLEEFVEAVRVVRRNGVSCELGFILLDPLMELAELKESLEFLKRHRLVHEVSSIFKELRIHGATPYVNKVREMEMERGIKILGPFNFSSQEYSVAGYLDPKVQFFAEIMRSWVETIYRLFYVLRIRTQYLAEPNDRASEPRTSNRDPCLVAIHELRKLEFSVIEDMLATIEQYGVDQVQAEAVLEQASSMRVAIVSRLLHATACVAESGGAELDELRTQALRFLSTNDEPRLPSRTSLAVHNRFSWSEGSCVDLISPAQQEKKAFGERSTAED
jgi:hypothetical protein